MTNNFQSLPKKLWEVLKNHKPFTIHIKKVVHSYPVNNVIYMKVEPIPELEALFDEEINSKPFGNPPEYAFVPHITIGRDLSNSEHTDVFSQLKLQRMNHPETIDRFHLLYQLDNGVWTVYETFLLGK